MIINDWGTMIETSSREFHKQAQQVNEWDRKITENNDKIAELTNSLRAVNASHVELQHGIELVESKQNDLDALLTSLESEIDTLEQQAGAIAPADQEREATYLKAEQINSQLDQMALSMKELVDRLNRSHDTSQDSGNPVSQIVAVMNAQLNSLQWMDRQSVQLNQKINDIERLFRQQQQQGASSIRY